MAPPPRRVCVTGGGGFIASWLVKLLLSRGYVVHATLRDPCDPKNAFLRQLDGAAENLRLFRADVLDYGTLAAAFAGCEGVFHPATPVPDGEVVDPQAEMMAPAVEGTRNVMEACVATKVQKAIVVSSIGAVGFNPNWPHDKPRDETCWSDKEFCKQTESWYCLAKTVSEELALEYAGRDGLNVVTLLPSLVLGPMLQPVVNTSSKALIYILKGGGGPDVMNNKFWPFVDVRDVADALLLLYREESSSGRYICSLEQVDLKRLVELLKRMYPNDNYNYVDRMVDVDVNAAMAAGKLRRLGWEPRKLEEMLADSVECYEKAGLLRPDEPCRLPCLFRAPAAAGE